MDPQLWFIAPLPPRTCFENVVPCWLFVFVDEKRYKSNTFRKRHECDDVDVEIIRTFYRSQQTSAIRSPCVERDVAFDSTHQKKRKKISDRSRVYVIVIKNATCIVVRTFERKEKIINVQNKSQ